VKGISGMLSGHNVRNPVKQLPLDGSLPLKGIQSLPLV